MERLKAVSAVVSVAAAIAAGTGMASAAPQAAEDGQDTFNVAKGTIVSATNSGNITFTGSTSLGTLIITCTLSAWSGRTGTSLRFVIGNPTFTDAAVPHCTDNLNGSDTITTNNTNGSWFVKEVDFTNAGAGDEGLPEPNSTGDKMQLHIPQAGLIDSSSLASGCTVTAAPSAPVNVTGKYNDAGTFKILNKSIPVSFSAACPVSTSTASMSATYTLSPGIFDVG